jgi:hypothetical protein
MDALGGILMVEVVVAVIIVFERMLKESRERQNNTFGA